MIRIENAHPTARYAIATGAVLIDGNLVALDATGKIAAAADAAGLTVAGYLFMTRDGFAEVREGIILVSNDEDHPLTRAQRGQIAYVKDDDTVSADPGSHAVVAGLVVDVDADGVWLDCRNASLAAARAKAETPVIPEIPVLPETGPAIADLALTGTYATWDEVNGATDMAAIVTKLNAVLAALRAADLIAAE